MKQKQLKSLGKGNKPKAADPLEDEHLEKMYECGTLGDTSLTALLHSLWLLCTTNFGMRTGQEVHSLRWGDIQATADSNGEYLVYDTERQTKTRTGANVRDHRATKPRAYAVPETPEKDAVHLYKLYAEKRPSDMRGPDSPFFLAVANANPKPGQAWYKRSPMGINRIYAIMKDMKSEAGIETSKRITPYSARKHLIQKLNDKGVPSHQIVQISGHKNINSLNNYSKLNSEQSKAISDIIVNKQNTSMIAKSLQSTESVVAPVNQSMNPVYGPSMNPVYGPSMNPVYGPPMNPVNGPSMTPVNGPSMNPVYGPSMNPVYGPPMNPVNGPSMTPVNGPSMNPLPGSSYNHFPMFMGSTFNGPINFHFENKSSRSMTHTQTDVCTQDRSCSSSLEVKRWKRIKYISDSSE